MGRSKGPTTLESWAIQNSKPGQAFYSEKSFNVLTGIASYYGVKIRTERIILIQDIRTEPIAKPIIKVHIL